MSKNIKPFLLSVAVFFGLFGLTFSSPALAAGPFFIEGEVEVSSGCEVTDTDGKLHVFPKEDSPSGFLGICALPAAKDAGTIENFAFIDFEFGLFLDSINGVKTSSDWDLSWSLWHNGALANVGLADLVIAKGDTLSLIYTSYSSKEEFDKLVLKILSPVSSGGGGGGGGGGTVVARNIDVEKAVQFIISKQSPQGLVENAMFTDWAALALAPYLTVYDPEHPALIALKNYFLANPDPGPSLGSPVLSFARRAMALMALGINPYLDVGTNYIQKITDAFDEKQIGEPNLVNDDIFGLLVLGKAGFSSSDDILRETTNFILSNQRQDGSWTGGVDLTAAAIQALVLVSDIEGVPEALARTKTYLQQEQQEDGGFGNPDSTSWAMQAIAALSEDWRDWEKNGNAPGEYLYRLQKYDGDMDSPNPVWSTAYAVTATLGKHWGLILGSFSKQEANYFEELARISQELAEIEKQALLLEAKVTLFAQAEAETLAKGREKEVSPAKKEELASAEKPVLSGFQVGNTQVKALGAQVGTYARELLPYGIVLAVTVTLLLLLMSPNFINLWITGKNE